MGMTRRQAIATTGVAGASLLAARNGAGGWLERTVGVEAAGARATPQCVLTGARTEGPFFVDEKLNRSDIRVDTSDGTAVEGIALTVRFVVLDNDAGCAPIEGAQVDVWHSNANGDYSDLAANDSGPGSAGNTEGKTYLRGFQLTDADGSCAFTTIFPGWYNGRTVHIHFKVRAGDREFDSQLFFEEAVTQSVNAASAYKGNDGRPTNAQDGFYGADGASLRMDVTGDNASGYAGTFTVGLTGFSDRTTLGRTRFTRTGSGKRILAFEVTADEEVTLDAQLLRRGRVLARRQTATLVPGARTLTIAVPRRVLEGNARLKLVVRDADGNRTVVSKRLDVPRGRS